MPGRDDRPTARDRTALVTALGTMMAARPQDRASIATQLGTVMRANGTRQEMAEDLTAWLRTRPKARIP